MNARDAILVPVLLPRWWVEARAKTYRFAMPETGDEPGEDIPGDACREALTRDDSQPIVWTPEGELKRLEPPEHAGEKTSFVNGPKPVRIEDMGLYRLVDPDDEVLDRTRQALGDELADHLDNNFP